MGRIASSLPLQAAVLAFASAIAVAQTEDPQGQPVLAQVAAADRVLAAYQSKDTKGLALLAAKDDPDPWLVADELCFRGKHDAAAAFAAVGPHKATEKLPAYVASRRGKPVAAGPRAALRRVQRAKDPKEVVAALKNVDTSETTVVALEIGHVRGTALFQLGRFNVASRELLATAKAAHRLGWLAKAARAIGAVAQCSMRQADYPRALRRYKQAVSTLQSCGTHRAFLAGLISNVGAVLHSMGAPRKALAQHERAMKIQTEIGDEAGSVRTHLNIGNLHMTMGAYPKALKHHRQARQIAGRLGDRGGVAKALGSMGLVHMNRGNGPKALECMQHAAKVMKELDDKVGLAGALVNLGTIHQRVGALDRSLDCLQRGKQLAESIGHAQFTTNAVIGIGIAYLMMGAYEKSIGPMERALEAGRKTRNPTVRARALANLAIAHERLGSYAKALGYLEKALTLAEQIGHRGGQAKILLQFGNVQHKLGANKKAITYFERALALAQQLGDKALVAAAQGNMAGAHAELGAHDRAIEYRQKALEGYERLGNLPGVARNLSNLGVHHWQRGEHRKALGYQERALKIHESTGNRMSSAITLMNIGHLHHCLGEYPKALEIAERALSLAEQIGGAQWTVNALRNVANTQLALGAPKKALASAHRAVELMPLIVSGLAEGDAAAVRDEFVPAFESGLMASLRLGDEEQVSFFVESGRAGALLDALGGRRAVENDAIPKELRQAEATARGKVADARSALMAAYRSRRRKRIRTARTDLERAQEELLGAVDRIQRDAKSQSEVAYPKAAPLSEIQATLRAGETLVSYSQVADDYMALVVTRDRVRLTAKLAAFDDKAVQQFTRPPEGTGAAASAESIAALRHALIEPLGLGEETTRVFVSPVGSLAYLPFSLLVPDREVVYVPSGTTYSVLRGERAKRGSRVLALGNPDYGAAREAKTRSTYGPLTALPATEAEAKAVGDVVLLGDKATETALASEIAKAERWRAVHFACHGLVNAERPQLSALAITPDADHDGFLTVLETFRMKIPADLVVLSACETAKGKIYRAEGVIGFARAFMMAGAPRVVVSLWKVDDAATSALMTKFYELWNPGDGKRGLPAATALRKAQEHVASHAKWQHPYYWAAWQLWGLAE